MLRAGAAADARLGRSRLDALMARAQIEVLERLEIGAAAEVFGSKRARNAGSDAGSLQPAPRPWLLATISLAAHWPRSEATVGRGRCAWIADEEGDRGRAVEAVLARLNKVGNPWAWGVVPRC
jgi:hypothetical protein